MDAVTTVWICINLVGAVCVNLGQNVMKLGHNKRAEMDLPEDEKPAIRTIRQWQIGVVVFVGGGIANFVSFGYAPQSLLSALGSIQFVSNVFFASFVLKEKVTIRVVFATACIVGGCILIVIFSASSQEILTVEELMSYYQSPAYITYICLMFVLMIGFYLVYRYGKRITSSPDEHHVPAYWDRLLPVSYAMFCAPIGTQSVLFSKTVSVLLRTTMSGDSQLGSWFTWVMLLAFILTSVFWVTRLNKSLKLFPAIVIVPTMQIGWTIFSIISGGIYFQEFQEYGALAMSMFLLGVSIIMVGVFYLTPPPKAASDHYVDMDIDDSMRNLTMASPQSSRGGHGAGHRGRSDADDDGMQEPLSPCGSLKGGSHAQLEHVLPELQAEEKASETHGHHKQHGHHHHQQQQGQAGQGQHPPIKPIRTALGDTWEEEWASSPASMRDTRRGLSLTRFSLDAADLEGGGSEGGETLDAMSPGGAEGSRSGERRSPPSKRHSFSDVSTPHEKSLHSRTRQENPGAEGFAMRLRSFRRALWEDWDLDFSALRQLGGAPAAGGAVQVPGVLGLPMPIMGEWYPAGQQQQQQQDPRASVSPTAQPPHGGTAGAASQSHHHHSHHQQNGAVAGTSSKHQQQRVSFDVGSAEGTISKPKSPLRRNTTASDMGPMEVRLDIELQGVEVPEEQQNAEVVIAVVPPSLTKQVSSERRSPTSPLVDAAIESDSTPSEEGGPHEPMRGASAEPSPPPPPHPPALEPRSPKKPKPKTKTKPAAEPQTADPPPRRGTPQHKVSGAAAAAGAASLKRTSSDYSMPVPHRQPPPPPVPHGSAAKPKAPLSPAEPLGALRHQQQLSPASPAEAVMLRPLAELQVEHEPSSPDDSREEADVTTPLTEGVLPGGGSSSSSRKHMGTGSSWRRALSGRMGGERDPEGEEDPLSSGPVTGPTPGSYSVRSATKQKSGGRSHKKGEHEELPGSSGDEESPPR